MISKLLGMLPKRTVFGSTGPYLTKYKLLDLGKRLARVYLHQFHRSDEDTELHSHPWKWGIAIVLRGGYVEVRTYADGVDFIRRPPGSVVVLTADTFHRVILLGDESWSLFIAGPESGDWYFMHPSTRRLTPWREFIRNKGLVPRSNE